MMLRLRRRLSGWGFELGLTLRFGDPRCPVLPDWNRDRRAPNAVYVLAVAAEVFGLWLVASGVDGR
jgi:hypothetical protein